MTIAGIADAGCGAAACRCSPSMRARWSASIRSTFWSGGVVLGRERAWRTCAARADGMALPFKNGSLSGAARRDQAHAGGAYPASTRRHDERPLLYLDGAVSFAGAHLPPASRCRCTSSSTHIAFAFRLLARRAPQLLREPAHELVIATPGAASRRRPAGKCGAAPRGQMAAAGLKVVREAARHRTARAGAIGRWRATAHWRMR